MLRFRTRGSSSTQFSRASAHARSHVDARALAAADSRAKSSSDALAAAHEMRVARRRRSPRKRAAACCSSSSSPSPYAPAAPIASRSPGASASSRSCARKSPLSHTGPTISQLPWRRPSRGRTGSTRMPRVVERGAQQIVHRGVDDGEVLRALRASGTRRASAARPRCRRAAGRARTAASRGGRANSVAQHRRVVATAHRRLVAIADAEPAAEVDVARARCPSAASAVDQREHLARPPRGTGRAR